MFVIGDNLISINDFQELIAESFFMGDVGIAGMVMFCCAMMAIFAIFGLDNLMGAFILMIPITLIFTSLSVLPETMAILLIIVAVMGLAVTAKDMV